MCYRDSCDTKLFEFLVEKFLIPVLKPGQTVIMDNASFHKSQNTKEAKCSLLFSPPYSPELDPIGVLLVFPHIFRKKFVGLVNWLLQKTFFISKVFNKSLSC
ncbi:hypothetical protein MIDIC_340011 [Alphaproteobacteria bacterium]